MSLTKTLNTRLALKIDTLQAWQASTMPLLRGEVAIATIAATAGTGLEEPVVMLKVGEDGVKTFNDIEWNFYAKASDVLPACKSEASLKTFINNVIAEAGIATSDAVQTLSNRVTVLEGDADTDGSVLNSIKEAIEALALSTTYVAQETGKSLVLDTEISKLSGVSEGANKVENVGGGKIKIDGTEVTVYEHPEKHTIAEVDGLETALAGKSDVGHKHVKADITDFEHTHTASAITDFATEVAKVKVTDAGTADVAKKVENALTVKVGGEDVVFDGSAAKTADVDAAISTAIGAIPEQTDYSVTITEDTTDSTVAKRYIFTQLGEEIGRIDLAKELVVTAGSVKEVEEADKPYAGAVVGDKYIELVIANQTAPIYVPAKDLVDIYTAKQLTEESTDEVQLSISGNNEISATLVDGKIVKAKLDANVQASLDKADSALQEHQDISHLATKEEVANQDAVVLAEAQKYADQVELDAVAAAKADAQATYQPKGDYATAAQGNKADTALQEVTSVAGNGIKVTTANNVATIDWDSEVVFIFNCGGSTDVSPAN